MFVFDQVFDENVSNEQLYAEAVQPLVDAAFTGIKVTCFAYGQTGSGKTFTMMGSQKEDQFVPGMFLLAASEIFSKIEEQKWNLTVWVSFYEIYCGKLFDLLNDRKILFAREDGKQVDLSVSVECVDRGTVGENARLGGGTHVCHFLRHGSENYRGDGG